MEDQEGIGPDLLDDSTTRRWRIRWVGPDLLDPCFSQKQFILAKQQEDISVKYFYSQEGYVQTGLWNRFSGV